MAAVDGENSSVEDMSTRQKIASFPSELYDANILTKLTGEEDTCTIYIQYSIIHNGVMCLHFNNHISSISLHTA